MGPENFEDSIKSKFEGRTEKAPRAVWNGIETKLNSDLIFAYKSTQSVYKWSAVAAIFIAITSLTFSFNYSSLIDGSSESSSSETSDFNSYNALLSGPDNYSGYFNQPSQIQRNRVIIYPVTIENSTNDGNILPEESIMQQKEYMEYFEVAALRPDISPAQIENEIYRYHNPYSVSQPTKRLESNEVWAGIEAGAGNFNTSMSGSNALSGSINPTNLASAVGTDAFVNPTTVVNPNLNEGIATSLGFGFGMKVGRKWTLESGVSYTNVDSRGSASINVLDVYSVTNADLLSVDGGGDSGAPPIPSAGSTGEATVVVEESYDYEIDLRSNVQFTSIPLKAGYFVVDKRVSLRVNAGVAANYFMSSQINDPSRNIISNYQNELYNSWSFDGIGGFELGYSIFDKFNLTIEPNYRHSIGPISNALSSPSRFAVQTGLKYTFK